MDGGTLMATIVRERGWIVWFPLFLTLVVCLSPWECQAETAPSTPAPPSSTVPVLSGVVIDLTGKPLPAARVLLITATPEVEAKSTAANDAPPEPPSTCPPVPVAADGTFLLSASGPGPWWVRAEAPGFAPLTRNVKTNGETVTFRLGPGGTIEGAVVAAADYRPIVNARVRLFSASLDQPLATRPRAETRTDSRGRYRLSHLEPDHYRIKVEAADFMSPLPFPVQVGAHDATSDHDFFLLPGVSLSGTVTTKAGKPVEGARVSAYPQVDQGPAAAKLVHGLPETAVTTTDRTGVFQLTGLPAVAGFHLYVNHPDFAGTSIERIPVDKFHRAEGLKVILFRGASLKVSLVQENGAPFRGPSWFSILYQKPNPEGPQFPVSIPTASITMLTEQVLAEKIRPGKGDLTISPIGCRAVTKSGLDFEDGKQIDLGSIKVEPVPTITGRVLDHAGRPVAQAAIRALLAGSKTPENARTENDGSFSLAARQADAEYSLIAVGPDDIPSEPVAAKADGPPVTLQIPAPGGITCRVFGGDPPMPLSAVTFSLYEPSALNRFSLAASMPNVRTAWELRGQDGEFVLNGLKPGRFPLEIKAEGFLPAHPDAVEITPLNTTDLGMITLKKALSVRGRIVEQNSSHPVGGAQLFLIQPDVPPILVRAMAGVANPAPDAVSSLDGTFALDGLRNGPNTLRVIHPGFCSKTVEVQLQSGVPAPPMTIALGVGGTIEGFFFKDDGSIVRAGLVSARSRQTSSEGRTETDNSGFFRLEHLEPGEYLVRGDPGRPTAPMRAKDVIARWRETKATVREGETTSVQLPGKPPIRVHGSVRRNDTPLKGALACYGKSGEGITTSTVDDDGQYELKLLGPGDYRVIFSQDAGNWGSGGSVNFELEITNAPDQQQDLIVPSATLAGRVSDGATGQPLSGVQLQLSPKPGTKPAPPFSGRASTETGPDGAFRIDAVAEGTYLVQAALKGYVSQTTGPFKIFDGKEKDDLLLALFPGYPVKARVVDEERLPVPAARITEIVPTNSGRSGARIKVDENGATLLDGLTEGLHDLVADARGFAPTLLRGVTIGPDAPEVVFTLHPGYPLQIALVDNLGSSVGSFQATLKSPDGIDITPFLGSLQPPPPAAPKRETSGSIEYASVPAGEFEIEVRAGDRSARQKVKISSEGPRRVTIRLP